MQEGAGGRDLALGLIHEGKVVAGLAKQLEERLNDTHERSAGGPPRPADGGGDSGANEGEAKRAEPAETLPRPRIGGDGVSGGCAWAVERITGEKAKRFPPQVTKMRDWFLVPND